MDRTNAVHFADYRLEMVQTNYFGAASLGRRTHRRPLWRMRPACSPASRPNPQKKSARTAPLMAPPVSWASIRRFRGWLELGRVVARNTGAPRGIVRGSILGTIAGVFVGWLPGLSNATANGVLASAVDYSRDRREYILATSAANTTNALVGLAAFFSIERTRNGVVSALSALEVPSLSCLILSATIAALAAYILTVALAGMAQRMEGIDRTRMAAVVIGFVILVAFLTTGPFGLLVLALATAVGCVPRLLGIPQVFCMGSIMLPVLFFSFGIGAF